MPWVEYEARAFPAGYSGLLMTGVHSHPVGWAELVWAAATVGRASLFDVHMHGHFSVLEVNWRVGMLLANVRQPPIGVLERSPAYRGLDPSEKGAISFFLGMAFTKWAAGRLMDTPWLLHHDLYVSNVQKGERPDFLGYSASGHWNVFESKGRSGAVDENAIAKAKSQVSRILTINGSAPFLRVAAQSAFPNGRHRLVLEDPEADEGVEIVLQENEFFRSYYRPLLDIVRSVEAERITRGNVAWLLCPLPGVDVHLLVMERIVVRLSDSTPLSGQEIARLVLVGRDGRHDTAPPGEFWGADGVAVRLGPFSGRQQANDGRLADYRP